jgi:hypothetical protein
MKNYASFPLIVLGELDGNNKLGLGNNWNIHIDTPHYSNTSLLKTNSNFNALPLVVYPVDVNYTMLNEVSQPTFPTMDSLTFGANSITNGIFN